MATPVFIFLSRGETCTFLLLDYNIAQLAVAALGSSGHAGLLLPRQVASDKEGLLR